MSMMYEITWPQVLQDFLKQNKESELLETRNGDSDFHVEKFKESDDEEEEIRSCESSPTSSEYSTESTLVPDVKKQECEEEIVALHQETGHVLQEEKSDRRRLSEENAIRHVGSTNEGITNRYEVTSY